MITVPIGYLIILPFLGVPIAFLFWQVYGLIVTTKLNYEVKRAEAEVEKCEKKLRVIEKNYSEKEEEIKAALKAYDDIVDLMGIKK